MEASAFAWLATVAGGAFLARVWRTPAGFRPGDIRARWLSQECGGVWPGARTDSVAVSICPSLSSTRAAQPSRPHSHANGKSISAFPRRSPEEIQARRLRAVFSFSHFRTAVRSSGSLSRSRSRTCLVQARASPLAAASHPTRGQGSRARSRASRPDERAADPSRDERPGPVRDRSTASGVPIERCAESPLWG